MHFMDFEAPGGHLVVMPLELSAGEVLPLLAVQEVAELHKAEGQLEMAHVPLETCQPSTSPESGVASVRTLFGSYPFERLVAFL